MVCITINSLPTSNRVGTTGILFFFTIRDVNSIGKGSFA